MSAPFSLPYRTVKIDITTNAQKEPWYLKINPNGRIPALKDGDLRVFETGAIMLYLCDLYDGEGRFNYERGSAAYYEVLSWIMWQMGGLGPMQVRMLCCVLLCYGMAWHCQRVH